jgi:alpha-ribazole phosphatase
MASHALPLSVAEDWAEWHFGDWEGLSAEDVGTSEDGRAALANFRRDPVRFPPPNAEPWDAFQGRIERALRSLASLDDNARVLVVSHAGPIRQAIALACGFPMQSTWAMRIDYGTRVRVRIGLDANDRVWGELIELRQACD